MARRSKDDPNAPELTRERIVASSIELIDRDGLDRFSLRALARHLGAGNMSVYYYVRDREELLELVLDEIFGEVDLSSLPDDPVDGMRVLAHRFVATFTSHPNAIPLIVLRPLLTLGPRGGVLFDRFVDLVRRSGIPDDDVADTAIAVLEYLFGHLTGHLPQVSAASNAYDDAIDRFVEEFGDQVENIRAIAPALRRAAANPSMSRGLELMLAGIAAEATRRLSG